MTLMSQQGVSVNKWIDDTVIIDFELCRELKYLTEDLEQSNREDEDPGLYMNLVEALDILCKNIYAVGKLTKEQWRTLLKRYDHYED